MNFQIWNLNNLKCVHDIGIKWTPFYSIFKEFSIDTKHPWFYWSLHHLRQVLAHPPAKHGPNIMILRSYGHSSHQKQGQIRIICVNPAKAQPGYSSELSNQNQEYFLQNGPSKARPVTPNAGHFKQILVIWNGLLYMINNMFSFISAEC